MKLCISGFDSVIEINRSAVSTLEIANSILFSRVCQSILSHEDEQAIEPFSVWNEAGEQVRSSEFFLVIPSPFDLPWSHRVLSAKLGLRFESLALEDDDVRLELERVNQELRTRISKLSFQMTSDYSFSVEWDLKKYLKTFGFGVDLDSSESLFDKLMKFFKYAADVSFVGAFVFLNLKNYLAKSEFEELCEQAIFLGLSVFLLEGIHCDTVANHENKVIFDQDLLEF